MAVAPDDLLTLIYTSGTTGPPRACSSRTPTSWPNAAASRPWRSRSDGRLDRVVPAHAHIADRGLSHYAQMVWGEPRHLLPRGDAGVRPRGRLPSTFFGAVPRVWEKLKAALEAGIAAEPDEARRQATLRAVELGVRKVRLEQAGEVVPDELRDAYGRAEAAVFAKIRAKLGLDRAEWYMIGAAPTPLEVLEFFAAIGIPICEVWGMSELTSIATMVPPDNVRLGTVGPAMPGVEVGLAEDREILVRGETVMAGYRNQPARRRRRSTPTVGSRPGDMGEFDDAGFLKIIDRKKELIINAAGKNMSPANIEQQLKQGSPLIGQAIAIGDVGPSTSR